ncbi:hypothetical protein TNCV_3144591 [Trichonephila clavipes]|nr:hypothetical protein TNCV_3144591 [Trichonephila clavipes]
MCTNCSSEPDTPAHILECLGLTKVDLVGDSLLELGFLINYEKVVWVLYHYSNFIFRTPTYTPDGVATSVAARSDDCASSTSYNASNPTTNNPATDIVPNNLQDLASPPSTWSSSPIVTCASSCDTGSLSAISADLNSAIQSLRTTSTVVEV